MWIDTWVDSEEELCPQGSLNHFYGEFALSFLRLIILFCLVLSQCLVYLRILSCVCTHFLAKMDSTKSPMGRLDIIPLLISKDFSGLEGSLDFGYETHMVSYLLSGQSPATSFGFPAINILELLSTGSELKLLTPGGREDIYLLPQGHKSVFCNCFLLNVGIITISGRGVEMLPRFL